MLPEAVYYGVVRDLSVENSCNCSCLLCWMVSWSVSPAARKSKVGMLKFISALLDPTAK